MENKEKVTWGTIFGVASVGFGAHAGGGVASGNQTMNFFVQYGWPAIFTPVIAIAVLALVYRIIIIMCNQHQVSNYSAWSHQLYAPYDKILSPLYEICNLGAGILATSASVAGAAAIINEMLHLPYMISVVILTAGIVVLSMFGADLISKASSVLVVLIVVSCVVISVCGLAANGGQYHSGYSVKLCATGCGLSNLEVVDLFKFSDFLITWYIWCSHAVKNRKKLQQSNDSWLYHQCRNPAVTDIVMPGLSRRCHR